MVAHTTLLEISCCGLSAISVKSDFCYLNYSFISQLDFVISLSAIIDKL